MVRWLRWHCPPDTGFEIRALAVWGRARYLSVTEAPHNTNFHTWMGKKHFVSFKPPRPGTEPRTLAWKAAVLTTTLGPPPRVAKNISSFRKLLKTHFFDLSVPPKLICVPAPWWRPCLFFSTLFGIWYGWIAPLSSALRGIRRYRSFHFIYTLKETKLQTKENTITPPSGRGPWCSG